MFFNRQSASIYEPTVVLLSALCEADFIQSSQRLDAQWAEPVSLTSHSVLRKLYRGPSIDASNHVSVHLAMLFQRMFLMLDLPVVAIFVNGSGRNKQFS